MKIFFLNPPYGKDFCRSARWAAKSRGRVQRHPEFALTAVAVLEKAGHRVKFVDGAALNLKKSAILSQAKKFHPDLAVVHTTTPSIYSDIEFARLIKQKTGSKTVLIGAHASAVPEETLKIGKGAVDGVARGEYDFTLRDLANGKKWSEVLGLSWRDEKGKVANNPPRPMLDVNELPFPAWQHIRPESYHDAGKLFPFLTLYTGRGCFGQCTFCREVQVMNGRVLRMRKAKLVVDEMEYDLNLYPQIREIMFETDTFTAIPKNVQEVCHEIIKRGLHKRVRWSCNVRVDIDLKLLPLMKKAGCRMLMVGFEFGTQKSLDAVKKGVRLEQSRRFTREAHRLGFIIHGCFMFGAPGETATDCQATIDFAKSLPLDTVQFSGICVYPGTEMYDWAKKKNYLLPRKWTDWVDENHEQVTVLSYPQLKKEKINYFITQAYREFYLRPSQILRMLLNIRSFGDILRKFYGLKSFLDFYFSPRAKEDERYEQAEKK